MPKDELLPGVTPANPPAVVCDARQAIRAARRRAALRDAAQLAVLAAVDFLFFRWPESRLPFLDRQQSFAVLMSVNALLAGQIWAARVLLPRWAAWRAASTWSRRERERFTR